MVNASGLRIATYAIRAEEAVASAVLVHGYRTCARYEFLAATEEGGAHVRWEGSLLEQLVSHGVTCWLLDLESHGASESGEPSVDGPCFSSLDDLARDVLQLASAVAKKECPELPLFLVGTSLGGAAACRAAQTDGARGVVSGVCALAPMLYLKDYRYSLTRHVSLLGLSALKLLAPTMAALETAPNAFASHVAESETEPTFYHGKMRVKPLYAAAEAMHAFMEPGGMERFSCDSLLVLHSRVDSMCCVEGSEALYERSNVKRKALVLIKGKDGDAPGEIRETDGDSAHQIFGTPPRLGADAVIDLPLFHNLCREPGSDPVCAAIAAWILKEVDPVLAAIMDCD